MNTFINDSMEDLFPLITDIFVMKHLISFLNNQEIMAFSHTCTTYRKWCLELGLIGYNLTREASFQFYNCSFKREINENVDEILVFTKMNKRLFKGANIISANLSSNDKEYIYVNKFGKKLFKINVSNSENLKYLLNIGNVMEINLLLCPNYQNVDTFTKLRRLFIGGTNTISSILTGASSFQHNMRSLHIHKSLITCVKDFRNVHYLTLSCCENLRDVSALSNTKILTISNCKNLVDVSALKTVGDLTLINCTSIIDISMLIGMKSLRVFGCTSIINWGQ